MKQGPSAIFRSFYRVLEIPAVYRTAVFLLAPGYPWLQGRFNRKVFDRPSALTLDFGCGPFLTTLDPGGVVVGADVNEAYLRDYTGGSLDRDPDLLQEPGDRKRFAFKIEGGKLPFRDGTFREARCNAVFHHLTDEEAIGSVREMVRCVGSEGQVVILDAVWPVAAWKRPLAWLTLRMDRGRFARSQEQMEALVQKACPGDWQTLRATVTLIGAEFIALRYQKP